MSNTIRFVEWSEYDQCIESLYEHIRKLVLSKPDVKFEIVGVARGGLVPAVHLSHLCNLPLNVVNYQRLDGDGSITWLRKPATSIIFVDDIYDTGATIEKLCSNAIENGALDVYTCCLYKKRDGVNHFALVVEEGEWLEFPWEV